MAKKIVLGILPDSSSVETALNNLAEADFNGKEISIVMQDEKIARTIADDTGPLKGQNVQNIKKKLKSFKLLDNVCTIYQNSLEQGKVIIAIKTDTENVSAAQEMLKDYNTQQVIVV